jgi:hypothetical protein
MGLYLFLIKPRLDQRINELEAERSAMEAEQMALARMITEIPELRRQLPEWKQKLTLYRKAIPAKIEDEVFLTNLQQQVKSHGVVLQSIDLNDSGVWLRDLDEKSKEQLTGMGVDVPAAQQIKVAFYTLILQGPYDNVITTLEELKRYGRIYSIEQVVAPAGGAGGAVLITDNPDEIPLQVSGSIFYGIDANYMNSEELYKSYMRSLIAPLAAGAHKAIRREGTGVVGGQEEAEREPSDEREAAETGGIST